jgi:hypothetical protein
MNPASAGRFDRGKVYVVYCDGIGCNASTKGAYNLARLGFRVKELLGGLVAPRRTSRRGLETARQPTAAGGGIAALNQGRAASS